MKKQSSEECVKNVGCVTTIVLWAITDGVNITLSLFIPHLVLRFKFSEESSWKSIKSGWWCLWQHVSLSLNRTELVLFVSRVKWNFLWWKHPASIRWNIKIGSKTGSEISSQVHWVCVCVCVCVHRTRSVFVEFSLYNMNTNLLAVFSFLFEFPVSERAQSSLDLLVVTLWPITGLDLQLLLMVTPDNPLTLLIIKKNCEPLSSKESCPLSFVTV